MTQRQEAAHRTIAATVNALGLKWSRRADTYAVALPGTRKLQTDCVVQVGQRDLLIRAFVARNPDQNHAEVYRWLLQRNLRLAYVAFGVDALGDIYLIGRLGLEQVTPALVDQVLGVVADTADGSFNAIVALGFADSIRREWVWRRSRGESTANLTAFAHLDPADEGAEVANRPRSAGEPEDTLGSAP